VTRNAGGARGLMRNTCAREPVDPASTNTTYGGSVDTVSPADRGT
jgi:hypothetical protein